MFDYAHCVCREDKAQEARQEASDLRRLVNEAHAPRARDINELHALQKTSKAKEGKLRWRFVLGCCLAGSQRVLQPGLAWDQY